jgi:hypothetical protein
VTTEKECVESRTAIFTVLEITGETLKKDFLETA